MSLRIGEAIILYGIVLLNIVILVNDGWICGSLYSQRCLKAYIMLVVLGCLLVAMLLSLIAAILHSVAACIHPDSTSARRLHVSVRVMTCLVAILDVFAIFYYYGKLALGLWNHVIGGLCAGMALAIAIIQLSYGCSANN
ncbi:hypothetical protein TcWFU_005888 [Taenia crassiceps]|uniref:Uncharacterized protein n=1 Tax=Taenia crassiceps TaxID=6207 RepID=A0ABR4QBC8_9CEST